MGRRERDAGPPWHRIAPVTDSAVPAAPAERERESSDLPAPEVWDGVLLFGADGRLVAATPGVAVLDGTPVTDVAALEARYRQSDGMPIDLRRRGRHVGIPVTGRGARVMLVSEPLAPTNGHDSPLAVAVDSFRDENDPHTVQRALGSVLAHELRTPLTTVYGGAELLVREGLPDGVRIEAARSVANAAGQLHRVIEDLVVLVRWTGERIDEAEPVLVQPILRSAVQAHSTGTVPVELRIQGDVPPASAIPAVVDHIVRNLIVHAVANTPRDGRVRVELRTSGPWVEISVADEGPALSEDERVRAFDLFAPASRQSADPSGANRSLVAARRLTERIGGRLVAGAPPRGAEAIVRLPAAAE